MEQKKIAADRTGTESSPGKENVEIPLSQSKKRTSMCTP